MGRKTEITLTGSEMIEKPVKKSGNSGRVYLPIEWVGKKVKIILLDDEEHSEVHPTNNKPTYETSKEGGVKK